MRLGKRKRGVGVDTSAAPTILAHSKKAVFTDIS